MAKLLMLLFAVCILPAIVAARFAKDPYIVKGCAYCDTCRCGFENEATEYMAGAVIKIECRNKEGKVTYSKTAVTDATGHYTVKVNEDRGEDCCDAILVKSSNPLCSQPNTGRDRSRVILTDNNGMASKVRYANALGFMRNEVLASCPQILQKYELTEDMI